MVLSRNGSMLYVDCGVRIAGFRIATNTSPGLLSWRMACALHGVVARRADDGGHGRPTGGVGASAILLIDGSLSRRP